MEEYIKNENASERNAYYGISDSFYQMWCLCYDVNDLVGTIKHLGMYSEAEA